MEKTIHTSFTQIMRIKDYCYLFVLMGQSCRRKFRGQLLGSSYLKN